MSLSRRLGAEALGSLLLAATVIGSGIMAQRLASGNIAIALLANTGATVAVLATLIALLGPVSGAHFNPAVSLVEALRGKLSWPDTESMHSCKSWAVVRVLGSRMPCLNFPSCKHQCMSGRGLPSGSRRELPHWVSCSLCWATDALKMPRGWSQGGLVPHIGSLPRRPLRTRRSRSRAR